MARRKYHGKVSRGSTSYANMAGASGPIADLTRYLNAEFPAEVQAALYSTAYFTQQAMKKQFDAYAKSLGPPSDLQRKGLMGDRKKEYYGAPNKGGKGLGRAFEYRKYSNLAYIGWLSSSASTAGARWQTGGTKLVGGSKQHSQADYEAAALKAGKRWAYQPDKVAAAATMSRATFNRRFKIITKGKGKSAVKLIIPRGGTSIQYPIGGRTFAFMDNFIAAHRSAIINTFRRKFEEKMSFVARGFSEDQIRLDFSNAARGTAVKMYGFMSNFKSKVAERQISSLLRRKAI